MSHAFGQQIVGSGIPLVIAGMAQDLYFEVLFLLHCLLHDRAAPLVAYPVVTGGLAVFLFLRWRLPRPRVTRLGAQRVRPILWSATVATWVGVFCLTHMTGNPHISHPS